MIRVYQCIYNRTMIVEEDNVLRECVRQYCKYRNSSEPEDIKKMCAAARKVRIAVGYELRRAYVFPMEVRMKRNAFLETSKNQKLKDMLDCENHTQCRVELIVSIDLRKRLNAYYKYVDLLTGKTVSYEEYERRYYSYLEYSKL